MINWHGKKIHVISVGATSHLRLSDRAIEVLKNAEVVFGAKHQFKKIEVEAFSAARIYYPSPWSQLTSMLRQNESKEIVMLASGDALFFGLGRWLIEQVGEHNCKFFSNVSSIQAAFALLNKPWDSAKIITLHGRSIMGLRARLRRNTLYGILTDAINTPTVVAQELLILGFVNAKIWVVEAMNDPAQRIRCYTPEELASESEPFHTLNTCVVETASGPNIYPDFPGLPDELFSESENSTASGMFTKKEVRLAILSLIQPTANEIGWDVGCGFGSVTIEWARWQPLAKVHAVENNSARFDILRENLEKFGLNDQVQTYQGMAPIVLQQLPTPDVVYIGGSQGGIEKLMDYCWRRLNDRGRMVVSAVTEVTKAKVIQHIQSKYVNAQNIQDTDVKDNKLTNNLKNQQNIEWTEIAVSKGRSLAGHLVLQPSLPVLLLCIQKR